MAIGLESMDRSGGGAEVGVVELNMNLLWCGRDVPAGDRVGLGICVDG